jgi:2-polyprenyl-3-methyl-5-hydroxy-6-metoxy-1,4-benzoquinol methylase
VVDEAAGPVDAPDTTDEPDSSRGPTPDSRWTVQGSIDDLPELLRRASELLETVDANRAVHNISLQRDPGRAEVELVVSFDHWLLPADLDYLVALHPGRGDDQLDDIDFVLDLAERLDARSAIDFGCGWGALALALAARGLGVKGIDPAKAMLEHARRRDGGEAVHWVQGDARAMADAGPVDLVVMTGNIPSIYVTDEAWDELLVAVRAALRPGGHVAFGSWNPRARPWESWSGEALAVPVGDGFRVGSEEGPGIDLAGGRERLHAPSVWRYRTAEELTGSLTHAGFEVVEAYGDWERSPLLFTSPEVVLVARRP